MKAAIKKDKFSSATSRQKPSTVDFFRLLRKHEKKWSLSLFWAWKNWFGVGKMRKNVQVFQSIVFGSCLFFHARESGNIIYRPRGCGNFSFVQNLQKCNQTLNAEADVINASLFPTYVAAKHELWNHARKMRLNKWIFPEKSPFSWPIFPQCGRRPRKRGAVDVHA